MDRTGLQKEVDQLTQEISRIVQTTTFNGTGLFVSGGSNSTMTVQVGQDGGSTQKISVTLSSMNGLKSYDTTLTNTSTVNVSTSGAASAALANLENDIETVSKTRASYGAVQNRFEAVISNLQNYSENLSASRSRIQDTDFASETANMTKAQILQQAATSILAQANGLPQSALSLLR